MHLFQGFCVCAQCIDNVNQIYMLMCDTARVVDWQETTKSQLQTWKERACQAMGTSASFGIAVGGAAATAAGAMASPTQGLVRGAVSAFAGQEGMSLAPLGPGPVLGWSRRAKALEDLNPDSAEDLCPKCQWGSGKHNYYAKNCAGLPPSA